MEEKKACPFCGEEINATAKKCIHCGNWLVGDIKCPTCGEMIKSNAKVCRFCGELVPHKMSINEALVKAKEALNTFGAKTTIASAGAVIIIAGAFLLFNANYVPSCGNPSVIGSIKDTLFARLGKTTSIYVNREEIKEVNHVGKTYTCSAPAIVNEKNTYLYYTYTKKGLFGLETKVNFMLPPCYEDGIKKTAEKLAKDLLKEDGYKVKDVKLKLVQTETKKEDTYTAEQIECSGRIDVDYKAGWYYKNNDTKDITYEVYFCENEYSTCVKIYLN